MVAETLLNLPRYSELGHAAMKSGLRGVAHLLDAMGNPERKFCSVHIAGTNGKGSVASMIASIGQIAGHRIGLYTSPHLMDLSERIRLNGVPVPASWMVDALDRHGAMLDDRQPSFFEAMTALSFLFFAESSVSLAVVEAGLGGRLDATNILNPKLSVITQIDLDHTQILGDSLLSIAKEKAGIIKKNTPILAITGRSATQDVVRNKARQLNAPWVEPGTVKGGRICTSYNSYELPIMAPHQLRNALLAAQSAEYLFPETKLDPQIIETGITQVRSRTGLRARMEILQKTPLTVLDVAHNPAGFAALLDFMPRQGSIHLLLSLMRDKDIHGILKVLKGYCGLKVYACDLKNWRACTAAELAELLQKYALDVAGVGSVSEMWHQAQSRASSGESVLICGSHVLAEAFLQIYL